MMTNRKSIGAVAALFVTLSLSFSQVAHAEWKISESEDAMSGKRAHLSSGSVESNKTIFTTYGGYGHAEAKLVVACDSSGDEWTYILLESISLFKDFDISNDSKNYTIRIKFDDELTRIRVTKKDKTIINDWKISFVHFHNGSKIISKMISANRLLVEVPFYGNQEIVFDFPLEEASKEIANLRSKCS